jgi:transposase
MQTTYFLGIDVSKKTFDAALTIDGKVFDSFQCENMVQSIHSFFASLKAKYCLSHSQVIVCMEHTGVYCLPLLRVLVEKNIKVCVEPAIQIKRSQGLVRGKNDKIDAQRIAVYAYKHRETITLWKPQRTVVQKLKVLEATRARLVRVKKIISVPIQESQEFIEASIYKSIGNACRATVKALKQDIKAIEDQIQILIKEDPQLHQQYRAATSVIGVGEVIAVNMIISTGEFERIVEPSRFACYAGVAPFEHRSGSSIRGKTRVSKMANLAIKTLLTMGAESAIRYDPELKAYYDRKLEEGKNRWSVLNAVRNKLITRVYACVKGNRLFQKNYQNVLA